MSEEKVILVDKNDNQIGFMPKLEAHQKVFFIEHFQFSYLIINMSFYFKKELLRNIIQVDCGQTHVAVIPVYMKIY